MARPKMAFTPTDAVDVICYLHSHKDTKYFWAKNGVPVHPDFDTTYQAEMELKALYAAAAKHRTWIYPDALPLPQESVDALKLWLTTYLSEQGWQRIQAARRQTKHSFKYRELHMIEVTASTRYSINDLVERAGADRPEYLSQLFDLLTYDAQGKALIERFHAQLAAKAHKAAVTMVAELTKLDEATVKTVVFESVGLDPKFERKAFLELAKLGKTKLSKALKAKEGTVQARLTEVVGALVLSEGAAPL